MSNQEFTSFKINLNKPELDCEKLKYKQFMT